MYKQIDKNYALYFGDARTSIPVSCSGLPSMLKPVLNILDTKIGVLLEQVHGVEGAVVASAEQATQIGVQQKAGDFLVTAIPNAAIMVATADCLPIVLYDTRQQACGIAHAGWRGSVAGVATRTLQTMQQQCNSQLTDIQAFFGPSARVCCYQVQEEFRTNLSTTLPLDSVFRRTNDKLYFDLPLFNYLQLQAYGILPASIQTQNNICTICTPTYCSVRREGPRTGRQLTAVMIR